SMSNMEIDAQARLVDSKLKVADLKDPAKLDKFLQRFTSLYDLQTDTSSVDQVTTLFSGASPGLSTDLILSLQKLRR
ncbi:MAG TPA: hypothetical protein VIL72_05560, partial [Beijerinckiaceae bacterium]